MFPEASSGFASQLTAVLQPKWVRFTSRSPIAILGQNGLDINNSDKKYLLKELPGEFSGLHLCSIMYAAFKQFAPNEEVGIDFSKEYEAAIAMRSH